MNKMQILGIGSEEYEVMDSKARPVKTIAEMKLLDNLEVGDIIQTIGYHLANDGGGATYLIREKTEQDIEDNGSIHFINDSLVAELIKGDTLNILQYGADKTGVSDVSVIVTKALNKFSHIYFPEGSYKFTNPITIAKSNVTISGNNAYLTYHGTEYFINVKTQITSLMIKGFTIKGDTTNKCFNFNNGIVDSKLEDLRVEDFNVGLYSTYSWDDKINNVRFHNCARPLNLESQSNNISFYSCAFSSFSLTNNFTNAEGISFHSCDICNNTENPAMFLFQSNVLLENCYFESLVTGQTILCDNDNADVNLRSLVEIVGGNINDPYITVIPSRTYLKFSNPRRGKIKVGQQIYASGTQTSCGRPFYSLDRPSNYIRNKYNSLVYFDGKTDYSFTAHGSQPLTQTFENGEKTLQIASNPGAGHGIKITGIEVGKDYLLEMECECPANSQLILQQDGTSSVGLPIIGNKLIVPFTGFASILYIFWTHSEPIKISKFKVSLAEPYV